MGGYFNLGALSYSPSKYGFIAGGHTSAGSRVATTEVFNFSIEVANAGAGVLSVGRSDIAGVSDRVLYGYWLGGANGAGGLSTAVADRIVFSTQVISANATSNLSLARYGATGVSDGTTYGFVCGGWKYTPYIPVVTTDRIVYSTGVTSLKTTANLSQDRSGGAGLSDITTYGYVLGGVGTSSQYRATTDRITFSTNATAANTVSNLSQARNNVSGISGIDNGYSCGGYTGSAVATTDKTVFSTSVTVASAVSNLSANKFTTQSLSNRGTYGYIAGGYTDTAINTFERIVFSTDVMSAFAGATLSLTRRNGNGINEYA